MVALLVNVPLFALIVTVPVSVVTTGGVTTLDPPPLELPPSPQPVNINANPNAQSVGRAFSLPNLPL